MELFNMEIKHVSKEIVEAIYHSAGLDEAKKLGAQIIQWVACENNLKAEVLKVENLKLRKEYCVAERGLVEMERGEIVQMVRIGFGRIDKITGSKAVIVYAHE
jgi:glutamyl-tRNA synthetase